MIHNFKKRLFLFKKNIDGFDRYPSFTAIFRINFSTKYIIVYGNMYVGLGDYDRPPPKQDVVE